MAQLATTATTTVGIVEMTTRTQGLAAMITMRLPKITTTPSRTPITITMGLLRTMELVTHMIISQSTKQTPMPGLQCSIRIRTNQTDLETDSTSTTMIKNSAELPLSPKRQVSKILAINSISRELW